MNKLASIALLRQGQNTPDAHKWWGCGDIMVEPGVKPLYVVRLTGLRTGLMIAKRGPRERGKWPLSEGDPFIQGTLAVTIRTWQDEADIRREYNQFCGHISTGYDEASHDVTLYTLFLECLPGLCQKDRSGCHFKVLLDENEGKKP